MGELIMNPFKEEKKYVAGYREFEEWIFQKFGKKFDFVALEEANNDSNYVYYVDGCKSGFDDDISKFLYGDLKDLPLFPTNVLLNFLSREGVIEKGDYIIRVYW